MALKQTTLQRIAKLTKLKLEDLEKAIKDEGEVDLTIDESLTVLSTAELETRDENSKNEGIKVGKEIGAKEVRKAAGLEDTVGKDPSAIAKAISDKAVNDAKLKPDEAVKTLKDQVSQLQTELSNKEKTITELSCKASEAQRDAKLLSLFPKNRSSVLSDAEYLTLIKGQFAIKEIDGKEVVEKNGQVLRVESTKDPISVQEAITGLFTERKWVETGAGGGGAGGRGGVDDPGGAGKITKMSEFTAKVEKEGKNINSAEVQQELQQIIKDNPEFKVDE